MTTYLLLISVLIVLLLLFRKKIWKPKTKKRTLEDAFPFQEENIPDEELAYLKEEMVKYLNAWGVNEKCEINEDADTGNTGFFFHSDPSFNGMFHWSTFDALRDYASISEDPNIDEFTTLFVRFYYDTISGVI